METVEGVYGDANYHTYWVDNSAECDDANNGSPDAPRCTFPSGPFGAGDVIQVAGGPYTSESIGGTTVGTTTGVWVGNGAAERPVFIRGVDGAPRVKLIGIKHHLQGSYLVVENFDFEDSRIRGGSTDLRYSAFRHNNVHGRTDGNGVEGMMEYVVIYDNHIYNIGDLNCPNEKHGIAFGPGVDHIWIVDNEIDHTSANGIQFCHGCGDIDEPEYMYIGRNVIHDNEETGVGLKAATNVIISQNTMFGFRPTDRCGAGSDGRTVGVGGNGIGDPATNIWILFNDMYASYGGVKVEASPAPVYLIGNVIHDLTAPEDCTTCGAVTLEKGGYPFPDLEVYLVANTVYGATTAVNQFWREWFAVKAYNNIFANLGGVLINGERRHVNIESGHVARQSILQNNLFTTYAVTALGVEWSGTTYAVATSEELNEVDERSGSGVIDGNIIAEPQLVDAANGDFRLSPASPAINAGYDVTELETTLLARFAEQFPDGGDLRVDFDGRPRPGGPPRDIGAFERP